MAQHRHRLIDPFDRMDGQALNWLFGRIGLGDEGHAEAQFGGFFQALLASGRRPHLARQTHFTKGQKAARQGLAA